MVKHAQLEIVSLDTVVGLRVAWPAAHHRALQPKLLELDDDVIHKAVFERQALACVHGHFQFAHGYGQYANCTSQFAHFHDQFANGHEQYAD